MSPCCRHLRFYMTLLLGRGHIVGNSFLLVVCIARWLRYCRLWSGQLCICWENILPFLGKNAIFFGIDVVSFALRRLEVPVDFLHTCDF